MNIVFPSQPKVVNESDSTGSYSIEGLYPGYGQTLGNSLRRIIHSSLPGAAITHIKIKGVSHEFSTINNVQEDVITLILNLKRLQIKLEDDESAVMDHQSQRQNHRHR